MKKKSSKFKKHLQIYREINESIQQIYGITISLGFLAEAPSLADLAKL